MQGSHRDVVGAAVMGLKLPCKIFKRIERMAIVKALLVFPVAAFHFAVVPGCVGANQLVDAQMC